MLTTYRTKDKLPRLPFLRMKEDILGTHYELSLACVSPAESKRLNRVYRKKNRSTNVLSFSLSKNHGEIIFDLKQAGHDAPSFNVSFRSFIVLAIASHFDQLKFELNRILTFAHKFKSSV